MQNLGFSGFKSLDRLRSISGSFTGSKKSGQISPRPLSDSISYGSFANLKITAEKLVKEQASVKTDLELAHTKLKRATEQVHVLEGKLQETINENAKLKVKQSEDAKLWKGLDSKLSSTKTLCDQLTETLQYLAGQTRAAEEDKKFLEEKLADNSKAFDDFSFQLNSLFTKLESAGNKIRTEEQEKLEIRQEKEELEKNFRDERCAIENTIKGKDAVIKRLEDTVEANSAHLQTLDSQLHEVQHELVLKEDICKCLRTTQDNLEREKAALQCSNQDFAQKLGTSCQKIKEFEELVCDWMGKLNQLDKESATVPEHIAKLSSSFEKCYELVKQEKDLAIRLKQGEFDKLQQHFLRTASENDAFKSEIEELKTKITELQKSQEFVMVQHVEECRLAEDKIRKLESEAEILVFKKKESEKSAAELGDKIKHLSDVSFQNEKEMQDLLHKISMLELEKLDLLNKVQLVLQETGEETEKLRNLITERDQCVDSLENQISQLHSVLDAKEQQYKSTAEREKELEEQKSEIQASLTAAESKIAEARKQHDVILEGKQIELSKHLRELSQRNDQAINDIRKKYELEKAEIANVEKEKAEKYVKEMERKCDEKISQDKEEAQMYLMRVKEEHGAMITRIQQDHDLKESNLRAYQKEELQRIQHQAETEMREKISSLRREHEIQIKSLNMQHEDDCRKLHEELELQKNKEEKQRALLQLQWKVMSGNQQNDQEVNDQEVNSKKEYSVSSKIRNPYNGKDSQPGMASPDKRRKDVNLSALIHTPMENLLKKGEKRNTPSVASIPKHSKKVTRHEYEVETSNGRTITKRRKTKSTVMFGEPNTHKAVRTRTPTLRTRTPNASKDVTKVKKVIDGPQSRPATIGDLFSEGSLNPYNDDPYAFD